MDTAARGGLGLMVKGTSTSTNMHIAVPNAAGQAEI